MAAMGVESSFNFRRVSDTVTTSGAMSPDALSSLSAEGYDLVVDLLPSNSDAAVADEHRIVRGQGVEYVHIPVDFAAPTRADYEAFAAAMDAHEGETVHVHCAANYRVSGFYSVYAVRRQWWTPAEADAYVQELWDPSEYPAWATLLSELRDEPIAAPEGG
jgi:protein tyrosine phosphatase (PTP) superfamily phosphohydrolase (DUF442 family)